MERAPSSWPAHCLVLYGNAGCGKTHLLNVWADLNKAKKISVGEDVVPYILDGSIGCGHIAIDDADGAAGDADAEERLQHLYNASKEAGVYLLLTAKNPVAAWGIGLKDIESRLKSCPAVELPEPDDALMRGMLLKQFADRQLMVENGVIEYLAGRIERSGIAIRKIVEELDKASLERGSKISVPFVQRNLV